MQAYRRHMATQANMIANRSDEKKANEKEGEENDKEEVGERKTKGKWKIM